MNSRRRRPAPAPQRWPVFVAGCVVGALAMWAWLRSPMDAGAAHAAEAPEAPPVAACPPAPKPKARMKSPAAESTRVQPRKKVAPLQPTRTERSGNALEVLSALAPALAPCLPGVHAAVPAWLRVSSEGKVVSARFGRGVDAPAEECARKVLVGRDIAGPGPVEELYVELSVR